MEKTLYFYAWRYYDPQLGRFIMPDTIVPEGTNPQDLNRYSYCNNNPIKYNDPTGHKKRKFWKIFFGIIIAVAAVFVAAGAFSVFSAALAQGFGSSFGGAFAAGGLLNSIVAGAGAGVVGGGFANLAMGQNPLQDVGTNAIAGAATGFIFNANVFQPIRDGVSAITNPIYRTGEAVLRKVADGINVATGGYAGKAFHGFEEMWNFIGNKEFKKIYQGSYEFKYRKYGANVYGYSSDPFARGTNIVIGASSRSSLERATAHELSHVLQNQILGPIKEIFREALYVVAEIPLRLNPQFALNDKNRGSMAHAISPFEHALQSYHGYDLPEVKFKK